MNEHEIANLKVLPYIKNKLLWPEKLISDYGRVPVKIGTTTVWADFVCYINYKMHAIPWILFEVKRPKIPLEQAKSQAESYSLILSVPFFCLTDGDKYQFYKTGYAQGKSVRLKKDSLSFPEEEYLETNLEYIIFPPVIDSLVDLFIRGLKDEPKFLKDTIDHKEDVKQLHNKIFQNIDSLTLKNLKEILKKNMMIKLPNWNLIYKQIEDDLEKFKAFLNFIKDFSGDPLSNLKRLLDKTDELYIQGAGIFFITQLLAGAHPEKYMVLEENISRAIEKLGITDILVKNDTANGYIYINEICRKLYKDKLESKLKDYDFGLVAVHNFLWHYYVNYRTKKKWA